MSKRIWWSRTSRIVASHSRYACPHRLFADEMREEHRRWRACLGNVAIDHGGGKRQIVGIRNRDRRYPPRNPQKDNRAPFHKIDNRQSSSPILLIFLAVEVQIRPRNRAFLIGVAARMRINDVMMKPFDVDDLIASFAECQNYPFPFFFGPFG